MTFPCPDCQESCKEKAVRCAHCGLKPIDIQDYLAMKAKEKEEKEQKEELAKHVKELPVHANGKVGPAETNVVV